MILRSYWGRLLVLELRNETNSKDSRVYFNHCFGVINVGLGLNNEKSVQFPKGARHPKTNIIITQEAFIFKGLLPLAGLH